MLKARAGNTVFIGLAHGNLDALKRGKPIDISLKDLQMIGDANEVKVVIFAAEDNKALMQAMIDAGGIHPAMAREMLDIAKNGRPI